MCKFKKGDTVKLKSGGPCMTVNEVTTSPDGCEYEVGWFDDKNKIQYEEFDEELLIPCEVKDNDKPLGMYLK